MKALYVTDCEAVGQPRWEALLQSLRDAPCLTVQIREREVSDRENLSRARRARQLLGPSVPLFVNRRFDIALCAGADGVHLPASGLSLERVRVATPRGFRIGVSTHSAREAVGAIDEGADLVVIGPIFDTPSKRAYAGPLGPGELDGLPLCSRHATEVYAIGGIDETTLPKLAAYRDRLAGVGAIRLFQDAADPLATLAQVAAL